MASRAEELADRINSILDSSDADVSSLLRGLSLSPLTSEDDSGNNDTFTETNETFSSDNSLVDGLASLSLQNNSSTSINSSSDSSTTLHLVEQLGENSIQNGNTEVKSFISAFNAKFGTSISTLLQALEYFDRLNKDYEGLKYQRTNIDPIETEKILDLQRQISYLQKENQNLKNLLETKECEIKKSRISIDEKLQTIQTENENSQKALSQLQNIIEQQLYDTVNLSKQRATLISVVQKQNSLIQKLDANKSEKVVVVKHIENKQSKPNPEADNYSLLAGMIRVLEQNIPHEMAVKLNEIRDDSTSTVRERIMVVCRYLASTLESRTENTNNTIEKLKETEIEKEKYRQKCMTILSLFEEELNFLQTLARSTDIQNMILYREKSGSSMNFSDQQKQQLIFRCAQLNKFIEETLGSISEGKFNESFKPIPEINKTRVFDLLSSQTMEENLQNILNRTNAEDVDLREFADILAAQAFISSLLRAHVGELKLRVAQAQHENVRLRNDIHSYSTSENIEKELRHAVKDLQKRENKIRAFLLKIVPGDDSIPTLTLAKAAIKSTILAATENHEKSERDEACENESETNIKLEQINSEMELLKEENKKLSKLASIEHQKRKQLVEKLKAAQKLKDELKKADDQINDQKAIVQDLKDLLRQKESETNQLEAQIVKHEGNVANLDDALNAAKDKHREEVDTLRKKLTNAEAKISALSKQISQSEIIMAKIKRQRKCFGHKLQQLQNANTMLSSALDSQSERAKRQHEETVKVMQSQYQNTLNELERATTKNNELTEKIAKLSQENISLNVAKKSAEIKLKAIDERHSLEKQSIASQNAAYSQIIQAENAAQIGSLKEQISKALTKLTGLLIASTEVPSNLDRVIELVEREFTNLRGIQSLYIESSEELNQIRKLLGGETDILTAIERLIDRSSSNNSISSQNISNVSENEKDRKLNVLLQSKDDALKQWEQWAKRVHMTVREHETTAMSASELRISLEEIMLASIGHRSLLSKLSTLRSEKELFTKFDRRILCGKSLSVAQPSLRVFVAFALALRKMEKRAGCLPMSVVNPDLVPQPLITDTKIVLEDL